MTIFNNISKRDKVLLSLLVVCLITVSLYQTLATDVTMNKTNVASVDMSYTFDITDQTGRVVKVSAGSTKVLDIFLTNNNNGTISYGIAYTPSSVKNDKITIAQMSSSKDSVSGTINKNEKKQISLVIINNSSSDITLTLVPVTGYEHGGDLIVPSNHTLISDVTLPESVNAADYITSLVSSNPDTMNNDDPGKNPRYMGASPNNYVSFNGELWRIIGVFDVKSSADGKSEKRVKIIRNEELDSFSWNDNVDNDWSKSSLQTYLNGSYYNSLTSEAKGLVGDTYWNLGGITNYTSSSNGLPSHFYGYERGTTVYSGRPTYWTGKIGLMYPSDYGYATSGSDTISRNSCLQRAINDWNLDDYYDCNNSNYIFNMDSSTGNYKWTITPSANNFVSVFYVASYSSMWFNKNYIVGYSSSVTVSAVYPTLYLKSNVLITGGAGTSTNPYKLEIKTGADYITSLLSSNPDTMNNDDPDGNVRYMGKNPDNYIIFNDELWRIIGVFDVKSTVSGSYEKRIKIIRNEALDVYSWDSGNINNWSTSSLKEHLNGYYYNNLTTEAKSLVGDTYWNLGGTASYTSSTNGLASHWYGYERGTKVYSGRPTYFIGKIGLMYPSDYGYATSGGTTTNRTSCLAKEMYNWESSSYSDCKSNDYLYNSSEYQWTLTPHSSYSNRIFYVRNSGFLNYLTADFSHSSASPVLYLKSTVQITGGEGTQSNPYTLPGQNNIVQKTYLDDQSLNNYDAIIYGGKIVTIDNQKAVELDGIDDYIQLPVLPKTIDFASGYTLEVTMKWKKLGSFARIIDFGDGAGVDNLVIANWGTSKTLYIGHYNGSTSVVYPYINLSLEENTIQKYKISLIKGTNYYDLKLYLNDQLKVDNNDKIPSTQINNVERRYNYIGKSNWNDPYLDAYIYDLKIYDSKNNLILHYDADKIYTK